jgi:two-component system, chemotaxis family, chemotaxis protein CheY
MSKRVLVVDDSVFMRDLIRDIFTSGGFTVVGEAQNGIEAVERFKELKPDLVTMDLVMPYRNGIDATREILKHDPAAIVVMVSALNQDTLLMDAFEVGAVDFIVKPPHAENVLAVAKKVLHLT